MPVVVMVVLSSLRDDPVTEISLKSYSSSRDVKTAVDKIAQKGGLSNVGERSSCPDETPRSGFPKRQSVKVESGGNYHVFTHSSLNLHSHVLMRGRNYV